VDVHKVFLRRHGLMGRSTPIYAVNGVNLAVGVGEVVGLVGESGCGKSTMGRLMLRLLDPTSGAVYFEGRNITDLSARQLKPLRRDMQVIFQDPLASLNPFMSVEEILIEPLKIHRTTPRHRWNARVRQLLDLVGLPVEALRRKPTEFSGGQQQRIGIARALALEPRFIVADEALSALDVSIQAQILNLFMEIQKELGISYLFISHNLVVVRHISHRIAVMYLGKVVETAAAAELYRSPKHPYTLALLSAVPVPSPEVERRRRRIPLAGDPPDPSNVPGGCPFHPRCWMAVDRCTVEVPQLRQVGAEGHYVACHLAESVPAVDVDSATQ
jgi:peptide/nickel transport system ATP-binding protein